MVFGLGRTLKKGFNNARHAVGRTVKGFKKDPLGTLSKGIAQTAAIESNPYMALGRMAAPGLFKKYDNTMDSVGGIVDGIAGTRMNKTRNKAIKNNPFHKHQKKVLNKIHTSHSLKEKPTPGNVGLHGGSTNFTIPTEEKTNQDIVNFANSYEQQVMPFKRYTVDPDTQSEITKLDDETSNIAIARHRAERLNEPTRDPLMF